MPDNTNHVDEAVGGATKRPVTSRAPQTAARSTGSSKTTGNRKSRTTRSSRPTDPPAKTSKLSPAGPKPITASQDQIREMEGRLEAVCARRDELIESILAVEMRLSELRRDAAGASETFSEASRLMTAARADAEAIRRSIAEADTVARTVRHDARIAMAEAASARHELGGATHGDRESSSAFHRVGAHEMPATAPQSLLAPADVVAIPIQLPSIEVVPAAERASDARERLIRYLSDARAVEREQVGLLQTLRDSTLDPELRSELDRHRAVSQEQETAIDARVRALGAEPSGGRGLLSLIVTRVWEAIHKPRDNSDDAVESALKALGVAELEAGMYLAVHALARAIDDTATAELAAGHLRQERAFADRLRSLLSPVAVRAARHGNAASTGHEST